MPRNLTLMLAFALVARAVAQAPPPPASAPAPLAPAAAESSPPISPTATAAELIAQARQLADAQQYVEAVRLLRQALERDPASLEGRLLLGETLMDGGDYDGARGQFKDVLANEPNNFRANLGMGKIWLGARVVRNAVENLEKAERVAPPTQVGEVQRLLASAYRMSEPGKALAKIQEVVTRDKSDLDALAFLVDLRRDMRQYQQAAIDAEQLVDAAKSAVLQAPGDVDAVARLSRAYELQLTALGMVGAGNEGLLQTFFVRDARGAATDKLLPGKEKEAAAVLARITDKLEDLALVRLTMRYHEAAVAIERAVSFDPENAALVKKLAGLYVKTNQATKAAETYQKVLQLTPGDAEAAAFLSSIGASPAPPPKTPETPNPATPGTAPQ